jgi:hypothetical protein
MVVSSFPAAVRRHLSAQISTRSKRLRPEVAPGSGFRFTDPNGTLLPNAPDGRSRGNVDAICSANDTDGLQVTSRTAVPDWRGERMDHQLAVLELIQRE